MGKTLVKCALVGGLIAFVWCMVSWMALPWHRMTMNKFKDEDKVASVINANAPVSGLYMLPCPKGKTEQQMKSMPYFSGVVRLEGMDYKMAMPFIRGLIIQIVGAYFITWLLLHTKGLTYGKQVGFITVIGLVVGILGHLPAWNWMGYPFGACVLMILDLVIAWFLAGLAIAKLAHKK